MKNHIVHLGVLILLFGISCRSTRVDTESKRTHSGLNGEWVLVNLETHRADEVVYHVTPYVVFESSTGNISGNSGCNNFFGSYTTVGKSIRIGPLGSTKMYCEGVPEDEFFRALEGADSYSFEGDMLILYKEEAPTARFEFGKE